MTRSLYEDDVYLPVLERIERLAPDTRPQWGRMDAAQMMAHCADVMEVANGTRTLEHTPLLVRMLKGLIRKAVVGEKPFSRSSPTHPQYLQKEPRDFAAEKARLHAALERFREMEHTPSIHPLFGAMTHEERGWAQYKHLDHHLSQFGV